MRIGIYLESIINKSHPIINIIKEISLLENIELFFISDNNLLVSDLEHLKFEEGKVYFIDRYDFLKINLDLCLSTNEGVIDQFAEKGILGGIVNEKAKVWEIAFDHRLFVDNRVHEAIIYFLRLIGIFQRQDVLDVKVALMTTGSQSVNKWILDMFKNSNCKIDSICYLAMGDKQDFFDFFEPCLFFEGKNKNSVRTFKNGKPLLFV